MRKPWPNCYYRKTIIHSDGDIGKFKTLSTSTTQDISLMNNDIRQHDPFQGASHGRPTHVSHHTIDLLVNLMKAASRPELLHYAGASYRDDQAWAVCQAWMAAPTTSELNLLRRTSPFARRTGA